MTLAPTKLFLTWQDTESRRFFPIGRLLRLESGYEFTYIHAVEEARKVGFEPLLSFPALDEVYRFRNLPALFSNRVMRPTRGDYPQHIRELGLTLAGGPMEPLTILARSGGRRATDNLEVFAPPVIHSGQAEGLFFVRGMRHVPGSEQALANCSAGAHLCVMADVQNPVARHALALRTERGELIGYVPDYLAAELDRHHAPASALDTQVEQVNPAPATVQHRLLCRFTYPVAGSVTEGLSFQGQRYQPLPRDASDAAA